MTINAGDKVQYRSIAGDDYPATVIAVRASGFYDIDVDIPGVSDPWPLKAIRMERLTKAPQ